mmetsp:Transcript_30579/g.79778  ORF Transcript_30579/g.79778 Transcript_30579/m.79778 type:complete len:422 (+) Transcript_30579:244-1509(+)|eukprot:CAMPEP_0113870946 /NCGR_PEP_ID=MMETSP0780_2-20120614/2367_1 /TAXON_ID=652834 /ORGANISM="Palpitomonas bilix" /LENGTH=421 /DNA_ID=CAMNT_0000856277 /DNA_START=142 /DNA_END=1407 /DNA_ORIENTATION=- /assembly_acc=CAM_ASM_000599
MEGQDENTQSVANGMYKEELQESERSEEKKGNGEGHQSEGEEKEVEAAKKEDGEEEVEEVDSFKKPQWMLGCRTVYSYERLGKIDEGAYGIVWRARDKENGLVYALKKIKLKDEREGFPITSLREVNLLLNLDHPNIVNVREVVVGDTLDEIFMVMEYLEHDFRNLLDVMPHPFGQSEVKCLLQQLLEATAYMHKNWVIHRDLKTSNLLMNGEGVLKICDFGLAREYGDPIKKYTPLVVTLWYRPPELLMGQKIYSTAVDMWSVGCIFGELLLRRVLFEGQSELNQLELIVRLLGSPSAEEREKLSAMGNPLQMRFKEGMPSRLRETFFASRFSSDKTMVTEKGIDLLARLLSFDPEKRLSAEEALNHPYFEEMPKACHHSYIQTFPATNEGPRRKRKRSLDDDQAKQREAFAADDERFHM